MNEDAVTTAQYGTILMSRQLLEDAEFFVLRPEMFGEVTEEDRARWKRRDAMRRRWFVQRHPIKWAWRPIHARIHRDCGDGDW